MSNLTGQQINQTYKGLLNLSNSTTGITSTFQSIEDGLGNDTGLDISTQGLLGPNIFNIPKFSIRKVGSGIANDLTLSYAADEYDSIVWTPFYDFGVNSYSSITYNLSAATSNSDVVSIAFYNSQFDDTYGLIPYQRLFTGGTITTTGGAGQKTTTLPSSISFSGNGGGIYWIGLLTTNVGATPTVKFNAARMQTQTTDFLRTFFGGVGANSAINSFVNVGVPTTANNASLAFWNGGVSVFESAFTGSTLTTYAPYQTQQRWFGFQLLANR